MIFVFFKIFGLKQTLNLSSPMIVHSNNFPLMNPKMGFIPLFVGAGGRDSEHPPVGE